MSVQEFSQALCFSYGRGVYRRGGHVYKGEILLGPHKLYLKDGQGEMSATFVPLEKIYKVQCFWGGVVLFVQPSTFMKFEARLTGEVRKMWALACDVGRVRCLKKKWWGWQWEDPDFFKVV